MNFTKRGNLKKANEMAIRATGISSGIDKTKTFTLSATGTQEQISFYIQFTPEEARQIIDSWERYFKEYGSVLNTCPVS